MWKGRNRKKQNMSIHMLFPYIVNLGTLMSVALLTDPPSSRLEVGVIIVVVQLN